MGPTQATSKFQPSQPPPSLGEATATPGAAAAEKDKTTWGSSSQRKRIENKDKDKSKKNKSRSSEGEDEAQEEQSDSPRPKGSTKPGQPGRKASPSKRGEASEECKEVGGGAETPESAPCKGTEEGRSERWGGHSRHERPPKPKGPPPVRRLDSPPGTSGEGKGSGLQRVSSAVSEQRTSEPTGLTHSERPERTRARF